MGLLLLALIAPEAREARRRAKLPGAGLPRPGDFEGALEMTLRRPHVSFRRQQLCVMMGKSNWRYATDNAPKLLASLVSNVIPHCFGSPATNLPVISAR